jgi:hypothetical protein
MIDSDDSFNKLNPLSILKKKKTILGTNSLYEVKGLDFCKEISILEFFPREIVFGIHIQQLMFHVKCVVFLKFDFFLNYFF